MTNRELQDSIVKRVQALTAASRKAWTHVGPWVQKLDRFVVLILLSFAVSLATPVFLRMGNLINVARQISIIALLAAGQTFVILTAGIDLSVGSLLAVGSIIATDLTVRGMPWIVAMLLGIAGAGVLGLISGLLVSKTGIPAFIVTLGMMNIGRGINYLWTGGHVVSGVPSNFCCAGRGMVGPIPVPVIIMFTVFAISAFVLNRTKFGRYVYAVGGNEQTAKLAGINVAACLTAVYVISGLLSGLGGIVLAGRLTSGQPEAGTGYELDAIAAVVVGGTSLFGGEGSIWGTLIGAFTIGVLRNGLNLLNVSAFWQLIAIGIVIILAVWLDMLRGR